MDKMEANKSYQVADYKKELYEALVKSYNTDKDLFDSYGDVFLVKRGRDQTEGRNEGRHARKLSHLKILKEPSYTVDDSGVQQDQEFVMGNTDEQPDVEAATMVDWFKKPEGPPTPDPDWNKNNKLTSDLYRLGLVKLNINNLTQEILVGSAFNLLKGTYKSRTELEYHFEECFKATNERLDWHNLEGKQYPFDLRKPLSWKLKQKKIKDATYQVKWIEDMVSKLWSPLKVAYDRYALWGISHWVMKWYNYGYLEEIEVQRKDDTIHKFKEGDFPNLNLRDIEDMLLLLVEKKISNLSRDVIFDLNVALRMPETFIFDISNKIPYTPYNNHRGFIYQDKFNRNMLMPSDELYKLCDGTLTSIRDALQDIVSRMHMEYLEYGEDFRLLERINWRDLPRDITLVRIEVLRYDKKEKSEKLGIVLTEMELVLEQTQQDSHGPSDAMHNPPNPLKVGKALFQNSQRFTHFYQFSHSESVGIEKVALSSKHQSDTYVFIVKMEILPVSTSNNTAVDSILQAGNPVKEILLKLNLPDHRSILTNSKIYVKMDVEVRGSRRLKDS
ncbi:hypothetical protein Tco_1069278 [Tanacetum coccineum]|uniref:Uncharacterized protein n=1 Tax=Tanacetum coccineum TaxID=301880 RepID=A0ABQ5HIA3_9ASTR